MKNFKNNYRRNRYRTNGGKSIYRKENGHNAISDFSDNSNFRKNNQWKNNQNASKLIEKYSSLAREALSNGDKILSENYFQHAEHFVRVLGEKDALNSKNEISKEINKNNDELNKEKIDQDQKNINNLDQKISEQIITSES